MSDNVTLPGDTEVVATDDVAGVHFQRVKLDLGGDGASAPVVGALPVSDGGGSITVDGTVAISGIADVDTGLVQPLTNTELRATPVPVSQSSQPLLTGGATFTGTSRDGGATAVNQRVAATFVADQASAADGARIEFSTDNTNWRRAAQATLVANVPTQLTVLLTARYWRVVLVNGATAQGQVLVTSGMYRI